MAHCRAFAAFRKEGFISDAGTSIAFTQLPRNRGTGYESMFKNSLTKLSFEEYAPSDPLETY